MKIINTHVHMIELDKAVPGGRRDELSSEITMFQNLENTLTLVNPESLFSQMDEAGISQSVLFACEAPIIYASNEYVAGLCQKHPDKLIGFASVDPRKKNATKIIEAAIKELGLKGLKFHPPLQNFYPNDKRFFPIYKKAAELDIPVVFHVGSTPFGHLVRLEQANPILLDEVAVAFPRLKIVLTHLGTLWHNEAFMVAEKHPNVYIDTACYLYELKSLLTNDIIERLGVKKFIFGTDYPTPFAGRVHRMKDFVDGIKLLDLSEEVKERIFFRNFEQMLKRGHS